MNQLHRFSQWIANTPPLFNITTPFVSLQPLKVTIPSVSNYQGNPRLGFLYQHLCSEILACHPNYEIKLEEVQVNRENGQTLGAIDLILQNFASNGYEHWEVAIKFYLLHEGTWFGPNAHDQLDKKLDRMLNHQLKMSSTPEFTASHPDYDDISQHLLLQGRLYINPFSPETLPNECMGYAINPSQINGYWCYESQWEMISEPLYELDKPYWATGLESFDSPIKSVSGKFTHAQAESGKFWFIVAESWPND